jgi:hypothetical protein
MFSLLLGTLIAPSVELIWTESSRRQLYRVALLTVFWATARAAPKGFVATISDARSISAGARASIQRSNHRRPFPSSREGGMDRQTGASAPCGDAINRSRRTRSCGVSDATSGRMSSAVRALGIACILAGPESRQLADCFRRHE